MKILDRYIIKKLILTTIFIMLIFSVIAVVIDASEKADDFVKSGLSSWQIMRQYYVGFVPFIISMIFPLMVFIGVIIFTSRMAGRSEIVAILAGGVKFNRLLRPYMVAALFLGGLLWYATQYWVPRANVLRGDFQSVYIDRGNSYEMGEYYKKSSNYYIRVDQNTFAGLRNYDTVSKTAMGGFFLDKLDGTK